MNKFVIFFIFFVTTFLLAEEFNIENFSDPAKYNWENMEDRFKDREERSSRQKLLQIYELNKQQIVGNMVRSAVAPGWGHYVSHDYTKGHTFLASEIVLFGTSLYFYVQAMDDYRNYENSSYIGDINQFYIDANSNYRYSQFLFSLGAVIWIYSIYDSISATEEFNQNYWNELSKQLHSKKIVITPTSITLRF